MMGDVVSNSAAFINIVLGVVLHYIITHNTTVPD